MKKIIPLLFIATLLSFCYSITYAQSSGSSLRKIDTQEKHLWSDGHLVFLGETPHFDVRIYLNPIVVGDKLELFVKLTNISDTIRTARPEMFAMRYKTFEGDVVKFAHSPMEKSLDSFRAIRAQSRKMTVSGQSAKIGDLMLRSLVGGDSDERTSDSYQDFNLTPSERRLSNLYLELNHIQQKWLKTNTLMPLEFVQGTVVIPFDKRGGAVDLLFFDGGQILGYKLNLVRQ